MRLPDDWPAGALDVCPVAKAVGPFPRREFVEAWWRHRGRGEISVVESSGAALPVAIADGMAEIAGEQDLTDYHSPLGSADGVVALGERLAATFRGVTYRLDSLPEEVAAPLAEGLRAGGLDPSVTRHEAAAVVELPGTYDDYLDSLRSKDRHEIRRKRRRFDADLGEAEVVEGAGGFDQFVELHRSSAGRKGSFMDDSMEAFFRDLLDIEGSVVSILLGGGSPVAGAFGFLDADTYYLYNSGFAPEAGGASPGVVLVDRLIAAAIDRGLSRFDFLKGDERYKYRMGAAARPLLALEGPA